MTTKGKLKLLGVSLTVIAAVAVVPTARGFAAAEPEPDAGPAACAAMADELQTTATGLTDRLTALPPDPSGVPALVNELLALGTGLVDLGCLPAPELPAAAPVGTDHAETGANQLPPLPTPPLPTPPLPTPPLPTPPVGPALPTVPVCTDLTADLLAAITGVLAALLSTDLPDLTGALDPLTSLTTALTGVADQSCLPAAPVPS